MLLPHLLATYNVAPLLSPSTTRPLLFVHSTLPCTAQGATLLGCSADEAAAKQENDPEAFKRCVCMTHL
jgi:hypothetical protein